jgi:peptidoglycan-N-acetylglucosamine deacetylase
MPVAMPPGKRCAVCWSVDFDAVSLWFGTFNTFTPQAIGRGEFGAAVGAPRLLELFERLDLQTTWFVPGHTAESWPDVTNEVVARGHEIGHHGYCHESPLELDPAREEAVIVRGLEALMNVTGERPVGYRSPGWDMSDHTVPLLLKHGFRYTGNGMARDFHPFRHRIGDVASVDAPFRYGEETQLLSIPSTWHLTDMLQLEVVFEYPHRVAPSVSEVERIWRDDFDYMREHEEGGVITYVVHPQVIGRAHRMMLLERVIRHQAECGDVWFARMGDIAEAWTADPDPVPTAGRSAG